MRNRIILAASVSVVLLIISCGNRKDTTIATPELEEETVAIVEQVDSTAPQNEDVESIVENEIPTSDPIDESEYSYGTVEDYSKEGCGFMIELTRDDGTKKLLEPFELDSKFQKDGLKIKFSFVPSKRPSKCSLSSTPININTIETN